MPGAKESVPAYDVQGLGFTLGSAGPSERAKSVAIISLAKSVNGSAEPLMISTTAFWTRAGVEKSRPLSTSVAQLFANVWKE